MYVCGAETTISIPAAAPFTGAECLESRIISAVVAGEGSDSDLVAAGEVTSSRFISTINFDMLPRALSVPSYLSCSTLRKSWYMLAPGLCEETRLLRSKL